MRKALLHILVFLVVFPLSADHFQDSNGKVIIRSDTEEFHCPSDEFPDYEATYEAPDDGAIRIWTDTSQCLQKDGTQYGDPFYSAARFAEYVGNIATYQAAYDAAHLVDPTPTPLPTIYADVQVSSTLLDIDGGTITFQGWLKDAGDNVLDVDQTWIIRLRDADGEEVDAIAVTFTDGATPDMTYSPPPEVNLGRIHIDESDFDTVDVGGVSCRVELLEPVEITIYREL